MPGFAGNVAGCAAVLAAVALLSFGLPAINDAIPPTRPVSASGPYGIGLNVSVKPPTQTVVDSRGTVPAANRVLFVRNGVQYRLEAEQFSGDLAALTASVRDEVADGRGAQAIGPDIDTKTTQGVPGMAARFEESDGGGFFAAYLSGGVGVDVFVLGTDQGVTDNADEILRSVATLRFGADA